MSSYCLIWLWSILPHLTQVSDRIFFIEVDLVGDTALVVTPSLINLDGKAQLLLKVKERRELKALVASRLDTFTAATLRAVAAELGLKLEGGGLQNLELARQILRHLCITDEALLQRMAAAAASRKRPKKDDETSDSDEDKESQDDADDDAMDEQEPTPPLQKEETGEDCAAAKEGTAGAAKGDAKATVKMAGPSELSGAPPAGCTMRTIASMDGSAPRWRGDLPKNETFEGKKSYSVAYNLEASGTASSCANKLGSAAVVSETAAQSMVRAWLWRWSISVTSQLKPAEPTAASLAASSTSSSSSSRSLKKQRSSASSPDHKRSKK